jgi:hypothetical protein
VDRSKQRPFTNGPRSLIRTVTLRRCAARPAFAANRGQVTLPSEEKSERLEHAILAVRSQQWPRLRINLQAFLLRMAIDEHSEESWRLIALALPELRVVVLLGSLPSVAHSILTDDLPRFSSAPYWDLNRRILLSLSRLYKSFPDGNALRGLRLPDADLQLVVSGEDEENEIPLIASGTGSDRHTLMANAEQALSRAFDLIVYGASGFTGRLVAEHLLSTYGAIGEIRWAMAGRSTTKLAEVRALIGGPSSLPLIAADASDPASLKAMAESAKVIISTVGPYQLYGEGLVAASSAAGTDYVDLCGEPAWMAAMIRKYGEAAQASGARIVFSCGFDSIPFDLGVFFLEQQARETFGLPAMRVRGRIRKMKGDFSGGTAASLLATVVTCVPQCQPVATMWG